MPTAFTEKRIQSNPKRAALRPDEDRSSRQTDEAQRPVLPFIWVKKRVKNSIDLLRIANQLNVNPSTVRKILEGRCVSQSVIQKIEAAFRRHFTREENGKNPGYSSPTFPTIDRMMRVFHLYEREKSLRLTGRRLGMSGERVRQLLEKGSKIGLFQYKPVRPPILSREKILKDYENLLNRTEVAKTNRISMKYLSKLMKLHCITEPDLAAIRRQKKMGLCREEYQTLVARLGHEPTTRELAQSGSSRSLAFRIRRLWGSLEAFREYRLSFLSDKP